VLSSNSKIKKYTHVNAEGAEIAVQGLYVDERTGTFYARVYDRGVTRSKSLETKSFPIAKNKVTAAIKEILSTEKRKTKNKLVEDFYPNFISDLEGQELSSATVKQRDISWRLHVKPFWAKLKETEVNQDAFSNFVKWHRNEKGGKIFNHLKLLRALVAFMRKSNTTLPVIDLALPKKEADANKESKGTYIEVSEIKAILKSKSLSPREKLMIRLAYNFGFRIGELTNLRKDRIKRVGGQVQIHLRSEDTKTRAAREVPLTDDLGDDLMEMAKVSTGLFVFPMVTNQKRPVSKQVIERAWKNAKTDANIRRKIRFHDLRHTAATNFANLDLDPVKACSVLGMSLKIYMSVYVKRQNLNLSSIADAISKRGAVK
jgi:integrase